MNEKRIILENIGDYNNPSNVEEYEKNNGYSALKKALEMKPDKIIDEVKKSELRGRGGAGFPTGLKWSFTAPLKGEKFIICNADEGEPGTFKDRIIMEGDPQKLIEGIAIACYAIGANTAYIYIRGEYYKSINTLENAIENARNKGYLGENILGTDFSLNIKIKIGAGSYVCGDETALIESSEGKRGNPRIKPPFPGISGLWKKPSVVNNVETLSNIPSIVLKGGEWYKEIGTKNSSGTKIFAVSGHVEKPGCYELPMGVTLRELIYDHAGGMKSNKEFKAVLIGGAAAGAFLGKDKLDVKLSYEDLEKHGGVLGSGAVLVLDENVKIFDVLKNIMEFFTHESCGKCVPCRIGNERLLKKIEDISKNGKTENNCNMLIKMAKTMKETSLCPLGQSPILPISTALSLEE